MADYKSLSAEDIARIMLTLKTPTVLMHARPDGDTVGTGIALVKMFKKLGIKANYACPDKISERLRFITEGEDEADTFIGRELVSVDVASPAQLGRFADLADRIIFSVDHHSNNTPFADNFTIPDESSAGEVLFEVLSALIDMGKCELDAEIAYPMYTAISSDTGGFVFSSTTPLTHRRAAILMETGIDFADINHRLFFSKSKEQIAAEGFVASKLKTCANGKIAYSSVSRKEREALGALYEHFETSIDVVRALLGAEVAVFSRENDEGICKVSIRSTGLNVAAIAKEYNGGGHVRAAGCTPDAKSAEEAVDIIVKRIERELVKNEG